VTFAYDDLGEWRAVGAGEKPGHIYSRNTNPTVQVFEDTMRCLEGAEAATSFSTGMAAVSTTLFALLSPGQRVVSIKDTYGGTYKIFTEFLPRFGIEVALCETDDEDEIEREIAAGCDLLYLESPTNPTLKVVDIVRLSAAAREAGGDGTTVVVDNTFATPINQQPLELGADLVLAATRTRWVGSHAATPPGSASCFIFARSMAPRWTPCRPSCLLED
jgi:cystathionine gamma-synthase